MYDKSGHSALLYKNFWNNHAVLPPNGKQGNWTGPLAQPDWYTIETRGRVPKLSLTIKDNVRQLQCIIS